MIQRNLINKPDDRADRLARALAAAITAAVVMVLVPMMAVSWAANEVRGIARIYRGIKDGP